MRILGGGSFDSRCSIYQSGAQTIATGTYTLVNFDTEAFDNLGEFNTTTKTFVAAATGVYDLSVAVTMEALTDAISLKIQVNGVDKIYNLQRHGAGWCTNSQSRLLALNAGDAVTALIWHNAGSNKVTDATTEFTYFDIHRIA